jgi:hypothetical protein
VVWNSLQDSPDTPSFGVYAQSYASNGTTLGGEFRVNTFTTGDQGGPSIAVDGNGNFVVVWVSADQDGNGHGVFGQRYGSSGTPLGAEFQVNTTTLGDEQFPSVASDPQGNFVVVWTIAAFIDQGKGQRFSSTGAPLGSEFDVHGAYPSVSADATGRYVVVWQSGSPFRDIFGQRFESDGTPLGGEFQVNTYTPYDQKYAAVASDALGGFVVVWQGIENVGDGSDLGIFGRRYDATGAPAGPEFRVNTYTTSQQVFPSIASSPTGLVVVTWDSTSQDVTLHSVYAQRYSFVSGDVNGDGIVDVGDVFYLINALFAGGPGPFGPADANGDGTVDVLDVFYLINYLFAGGPPPKQ